MRHDELRQLGCLCRPPRLIPAAKTAAPGAEAADSDGRGRLPPALELLLPNAEDSRLSGALGGGGLGGGGLGGGDSPSDSSERAMLPRPAPPPPLLKRDPSARRCGAAALPLSSPMETVACRKEPPSGASADARRRLCGPALELLLPNPSLGGGGGKLSDSLGGGGTPSDSSGRLLPLAPALLLPLLPWTRPPGAAMLPPSSPSETVTHDGRWPVDTTAPAAAPGADAGGNKRGRLLLALELLPGDGSNSIRGGDPPSDSPA